MPYCFARSAFVSPLLAISVTIVGLGCQLVGGTSSAWGPAAAQGQTPASPTTSSRSLPPAAGQPTGQPPARSGTSSRSSNEAALAAIPMDRLTASAQARIQAITQRPTLYRHLPQQSIQCDADLFLYVVRNPEILVGIWDLMEITEVKTQRLDAFRLRALDGSGTDCTVDLVYGDSSIHVFVADGFYDGKLTANRINGQGVFVLRSVYRQDAAGNSVVDGTLDCFLQVDHLAADLIIRSFGPLIGKTADHNFAETARFIDQLGTHASQNPDGMEELAMRLPQVQPPTRQQFAALIQQAGARYQQRPRPFTPASSRSASNEPSLNSHTEKVRSLHQR